MPGHNDQGPVVQGIVSLTNSLRGEVLKVFYDLITQNNDIFVGKMGEAFALKASPIFSTKMLANFRY